jgi:hypothetical protein
LVLRREGGELLDKVGDLRHIHTQRVERQCNAPVVRRVHWMQWRCVGGVCAGCEPRMVGERLRRWWR